MGPDNFFQVNYFETFCVFVSSSFYRTEKVLLFLELWIFKVCKVNIFAEGEISLNKKKLILFTWLPQFWKLRESQGNPGNFEMDPPPTVGPEVQNLEIINNFFYTWTRNLVNGLFERYL